jgi:hypothetical protein
MVYNIEGLKVNRERYDHKAILEALYMFLNLSSILNSVTVSRSVVDPDP